MGTAVAPTTVFGADPNKPLGTPGAATGEAGSSGGGGGSHLMDEITDAPQLFEYEDIAHSGHLLMKVVDLVPPKPGSKKKKKKEELEYFILLNTKHVVHFQPNTGMVDPFKKTIKGKAIDPMQAMIAQSAEEEVVDIPPALLEGFSVDALTDGFEIRTARQLYMLKPKESSAEAWIEAITEVMFDDGGERNSRRTRRSVTMATSSPATMKRTASSNGPSRSPVVVWEVDKFGKCSRAPCHVATICPSRSSALAAWVPTSPTCCSVAASEN